jgi:hypothetical protein
MAYATKLPNTKNTFDAVQRIVATANCPFVFNFAPLEFSVTLAPLIVTTPDPPVPCIMLI